MNILDIVKDVGGGLIRQMVPGGGMILDVVNGFLPDDKKLGETATGEDVRNAVESLPPEQRAQLVAKQFDVDMTQIKEGNSTVRAMLDADTKTPHTTRPYIAKGSFHVIAFVIVAVVTIWAYGVIKQDAALVETVMGGWPFILAAIGPLVVLLHAYFGVIKHEHKNRLDAANGAAHPVGLAGLVSAFVKR